MYTENDTSDWQDDAPSRSSKSSFGLKLGGVFLLVVGGIGIIVSFLFLGISPAEIGALLGYNPGFVTNVLFMLFVVGFLLSLGVFMGGYFAFKHSHFVLSIIGAVIALVIGIISPLFIGTILGVVALLLIATNHAEFD